jgi:hypothetical protein
VARWLVHGGRAIKYVVVNSVAGYKNNQNLPTDFPDEPLFKVDSLACVGILGVGFTVSIDGLPTGLAEQTSTCCTLQDRFQAQTPTTANASHGKVGAYSAGWA